MPTYEYICDACGTEFEKFQSITAEPIKVCPNCGKEQARRKISGGAAIIFKGGGFYETDYRSDSYNAAKKKDAEGGGSTETKTDSAKPAEAPKADAAAKPETPKPAPVPAPPAPAATPKPSEAK